MTMRSKLRILIYILSSHKMILDTTANKEYRKYCSIDVEKLVLNTCRTKTGLSISTRHLTKKLSYVRWRLLHNRQSCLA